LIFSEGVVAQYLDNEQKQKIADYSKRIMRSKGSSFVLDDTLKNHKELHSNPIIQEGMGRISRYSNSNTYIETPLSFEESLDFWQNIFNNSVYTVDYMLSKLEMDFALKSFKLMVYMNDVDGDNKVPILELSEKNKNNRIWK
jgi:hypothetical protein